MFSRRDSKLQTMNNITYRYDLIKVYGSTWPNWKQLMDASTTHTPIIDAPSGRQHSVRENISNGAELTATISPSTRVPFVITAHTSRITTCINKNVS